MDDIFELSNGFSFKLGEYKEIRNEILIDTYGSKSKGFMLGAVSLIYQQLKSLGLKLNTYLENYNSFNNNIEFTSVTFGIYLSEVEDLTKLIYAIGRILLPYGIKCIALEQDGFKLIDLRTKEAEEGEISDSYKEIKIKSLSSLNKDFMSSYIEACVKNIEKSEGMINIDANDLRSVISNSNIVYFYNGYYINKEFMPNKLSMGPASKAILSITAPNTFPVTMAEDIIKLLNKINGEDISVIVGYKENNKLPYPEITFIATKEK